MCNIKYISVYLLLWMLHNLHKILGWCPGLARIGLSFPSSGGEALAGLFHTMLPSPLGAQARQCGRVGERVCYAISLFSLLYW